MGTVNHAELQKLRNKLQQFIPGYAVQQQQNDQQISQQTQSNQQKTINVQDDVKEISILNENNEQLIQQQNNQIQQQQQQDLQFTKQQQQQQLFNSPEIEDQYTLKSYQYQQGQGQHIDVLDSVMTLNALSNRLQRNRSRKQTNIFTTTQQLEQQARFDATLNQTLNEYRQLEGNCEQSMVQSQMFGQQQQQKQQYMQPNQINYQQLQQNNGPHSFVLSAMLQKHEIDNRRGLDVNDDGIYSIAKDFTNECVVPFKQINQDIFQEEFIGKQKQQNNILTTQSLGITVEEEPLDEQLDKQIQLMSKTAKLMLDSEQMKRDDYQIMLQKNDLECKRLSYNLLKQQNNSYKLSENTLKMTQMQRLNQPKKISQMTEEEVDQMLAKEVKQLVV